MHVQQGDYHLIKGRFTEPLNSVFTDLTEEFIVLLLMFSHLNSSLPCTH